MKSFDKVFLTGCDYRSEWMLPWFLGNYKKHNRLPIIFANFGVSEDALNIVSSTCGTIIDMTQLNEKGWFKKPKAMIEASKFANAVCWIDTDCQILSSIQDVFTHVQPNKLAMVEDKPWSTRRQQKWHNTGVVAFEGRPMILDEWAKVVQNNADVGDQEVLHSILGDDLRRLSNVTDLPAEYNWLRLMLKDGMDSPKKKIVHWTGPIGKQKIMELING